MRTYNEVEAYALDNLENITKIGEDFKDELMDRLTKCQNTKKNMNRDIMTFSGMCDDLLELYNYVIQHEAA